MTDQVEKQLQDDLDKFRTMAEEVTDPLAICLVGLVIDDLIANLENARGSTSDRRRRLADGKPRVPVLARIAMKRALSAGRLQAAPAPRRKLAKA